MAKSSPGHAGNMNLHGKRSKLMPCGCCDCVDLKTPMLERIARREALDELLEMDGELYDLPNPHAEITEALTTAPAPATQPQSK